MLSEFMGYFPGKYPVVKKFDYTDLALLDRTR